MGLNKTPSAHNTTDNKVKKRVMDKRKFLWGIIIILILVIVAVAFIILSPKKEEIPKPDSIDIQCAFACNSHQKVAFCDVERALSDGAKATCKELSTNLQYSTYNVAACPTISCVLTAEELDKTCVTGLNSVWVTPGAGDTCPVQEGKFSRKRTPSDNPPVEGQICCFYYE